MLKIETITELKNTFESIETDLSELGILPNPSVEVISLDLVRIHLNFEGRADAIAERIAAILAANNESGPLRIRFEAAKSCNLIYYVDIISI